MKQAIGEFLLRRLEEVGIRHIFGVPGDFNLELLQQLEDRGKPAASSLPPPIVWIGNCNELNGAYAADGYGRVCGLSALIVTEGVGALSAVNGVAGAYSERVPMICICGSLPRDAVERGRLMHHTMADGSRDRFFRIFTEITAAQARLSPQNAVGEIDRLILTAWRSKLPVYLELPSDIATLTVDVPQAPLVLGYEKSDPERLRSCIQMIASRIQRATQPALLLSTDAQQFRVTAQIHALAEKLQIKVAILQGAKGVFDEHSGLFAGTYMGSHSAAGVRKLVEESDCLLAVGYRRVDWTSDLFSDKIPEDAIHLNLESTLTNTESFQGVFLEELLCELIKDPLPTVLGSKLLSPAPAPAPALSFSPSSSSPSSSSPSTSSLPTSQAPLTQKSYWSVMQQFFQPDDLIVAEDGTSSIGINQVKLPPRTTLITQSIWGSIGFSVGCLLGTLLASPQRRQILLVGDGSFQLTGQEVSTMLRHGLTPYIFLINNGGYTIERAILGSGAKYNDIAEWDYTALVRSLSRTGKVETLVVKTAEELSRAVLGRTYSSMVFIEVVMEPRDYPVGMAQFGSALADLDYGPRGPQVAGEGP